MLITVTFSDAITHCRGQRNSLHGNSQRNFTALFNNTWTRKSNKGRPTNAFFAVRRILPAYDYWRALPRCLSCARRFELGSRRKLGGGTNIWLTVAKNAFVGWAMNFRVLAELSIESYISELWQVILPNYLYASCEGVFVPKRFTEKESFIIWMKIFLSPSV